MKGFRIMKAHNTKEVVICGYMCKKCELVMAERETTNHKCMFQMNNEVKKK